MIASFACALIDQLRASMSDTECDAALREAIDEIYQASLCAQGLSSRTQQARLATLKRILTGHSDTNKPCDMSVKSK